MLIKLLTMGLKIREQSKQEQLDDLFKKHIEAMNNIKVQQQQEKLKQLQLKNIVKVEKIKLIEGITYTSTGINRDIIKIEINKGGLNVIYRQWDYKRDTQAIYTNTEFKTQQEALKFFGKKERI